jgi:acetate kinase
MTPRGSVLALNSGSSSLKFALFGPGDSGAASLRGDIEDIGASPHLIVRDAQGAVVADRQWSPGERPAFADLMESLLQAVEHRLGPQPLDVVGHRVVHGGARHIAPARVKAELLTDLEALTPLDPLHMPHSLAPIRAITAARPELPQVACFDTAFHQTMPPVASRIAVPRALWDEGVRRYGFHGLSYEHVARCLKTQAPALSGGRVIVAHLGSGASLCALLEGRSIATTMGFSALDGLMMATRCGALDPGVILYLGRKGLSFPEVETMLYEASGLFGVSGISGDMRALLASGDPRAREAIELFVYRIATEAGALVSALGGLDGLVFTAGIGENAPAIRELVCHRLAWLGLRIDAQANASGNSLISAPGSRVEVRVVPADEEAVIAHHARAVLGNRGPA